MSPTRKRQTALERRQPTEKSTSASGTKTGVHQSEYTTIRCDRFSKTPISFATRAKVKADRLTPPSPNHGSAEPTITEKPPTSATHAPTFLKVIRFDTQAKLLPSLPCAWESALHDSAVGSPTCQLVAIRELELSQHRRHVGFDCLYRQRQLASDFFVGIPASNET